MTDPKKDPARRCMPLSEWPEQHRIAWEAAIAPGDPFTGIGKAAHWSSGTRCKIISSYGRFLTYRKRRGALNESSGPGECIHLDLLRDYGVELETQVAPVTFAQRFIDLHEALRVMAPEADISDLKRASQVLSARARPSRNKRLKRD